MAISWRLKTYLLTKHSIYKIVDLQKIIIKKTGIKISLQNLSKIIGKRPSQIRLETFEIICTALNCNLSDFLEIKPKKYKKIGKVKKLSFKNTRHDMRGTNTFPNPEDYN